MESTETSVPALRELVQRFRVCWKVWPELAYVGGEKRQIGYQLELAGTHEPGVEHPEPGCEHCQHVFAALRDIAEWIVPPATWDSQYDIGSYDQAIRYSVAHRNRPDIILIIRIVHRTGFEQPVEECQSRCLEEMEQRLTELGASRRSWRSGRKAHGASLADSLAGGYCRMDSAGTLAFFQLSRPRRVGRPAACSQSCCGCRCDRGSQPQTSPWASVAVATAFRD